jgi:hypothetical protein
MVAAPGKRRPMPQVQKRPLERKPEMTTATEPITVTLTPEHEDLCQQVARSSYRERRATLHGWLDQQGLASSGSIAEATWAALIQRVAAIVQEREGPRTFHNSVLARAAAKQQRAARQGQD